MTPPYLLRHRPLITPRISFRLAPPAPLPTLTPRIEFNSEYLKRQRAPEDSEVSTGAKRQRRSQTPQASASANQDETLQLIDDEGDEEDDSITPTPAGEKLISKPQGEPGRPGSGGFSLEDALEHEHNWSKTEVENLNKLVREVAEKSMNMTVTYKKQDKEKIQDICDKVQEQIPHLAQYEECWPVRSVLKLVLKYRSESSRRAQIKADSERMRLAAR
ncbi:hypothetical protein BDN70DRAFT_938156 [Pholiota conissans]|uniref:Uncharacterized protein n=1 Tax=Pholiota conissans TaxID=109636 RepID=A0A9P6CUD6_9AGAR|nr:hypothetical protein BDN70DRAFT_938156 [Pholiota conissans]